MIFVARPQAWSDDPRPTPAAVGASPDGGGGASPLGDGAGGARRPPPSPPPPPHAQPPPQGRGGAEWRRAAGALEGLSARVEDLGTWLTAISARRAGGEGWADRAGVEGEGAGRCGCGGK